MEYFSIVYKILKAIESSMDYPEFDKRIISHDALGISKDRWLAIMNELVECGYIKGVEQVPMVGQPIPALKITKPRLTIQGAEYLSENSMMKKAYNLARGISEIIPK